MTRPELPEGDRRSAPIAAVAADVIGSRQLPHPETTLPRLEQAAVLLNETFAEALMQPFAALNGDELQGALADPAQAPLCISLLREDLAPIQVRVGVGLGVAPPQSDESTTPLTLARAAMAVAKRQGGVMRYLGSGPATDILLNALCRLVDPLLQQRTSKQWQAIAAYRTLGHQRDVARLLGVTRQSVGDRLAAGHRREVEQADAAIAAYLTFLRES